MGRKNKLQRFAEMKTFGNVVEPSLDDVKTGDYHLKGKWKDAFFKNDRPIVLELGCGKGEYSIELSRRYPEKNFIGIDIKGARIWVGAKEALENNYPNVGFIRSRIDFIEAFFEKNEVDEIWITFPDPQLKKRQIKKRLTAPRFLDRYKKFLKPEGIIHLKTDSQQLYEYTLEVINENNYNLIEATNDLYGRKIENTDPETKEILSIRTYYESKFLEDGKKITYLKFTF